MLIISTKVWDTLPVDVRKALQQAADESEAFQRKLWKEKTDECLALAKERRRDHCARPGRVPPSVRADRAGQEYLPLRQLLSEIGGEVMARGIV
jgi:hypothetical protein